MKALEYLIGITGPECQRLRKRGIRHTNALLHATSLIADRRRVSSKTGMSDERLLDLGNQCALLEISGMDRYQRPVWRLGITSLKDLKKQDPHRLHAKILEVVGPHAAPSVQMVEYWVSQARAIDMIEEDEPSSTETSPSIRGMAMPDARRTEI